MIFLRSRRDSETCRFGQNEILIFLCCVALKIAFDIFLFSRVFLLFYVFWWSFQEKEKKRIKKKRKKKINLSCVKWRSLLKFAEFSDLFSRGGKNKKTKKKQRFYSQLVCEIPQKSFEITVEKEEKC